MNMQRFLGGLALSIVLSLILVSPTPGFSAQEGPGPQAAQEPRASLEPQAAATAKPASNELVIRNYTLRHIKPEAVVNVARLLGNDATFAGNILTVRIWTSQIPQFEELLKKLDVEKRLIQFQVFAVVASRDGDEERRSNEAREKAAASPLPAVKGKPGSSTAPGPAAHPGEPITLNFRDTDLRDVILFIAEFAHLNIVFDPDVRGKVTCNLEKIPWDQALDIILAQNQMAKVIDGNMLRIAPLRVLMGDSNPEKSPAVENKELKRVLDELKALWNFKSYEVDGPSFVTVKEDSGPDNFKLVTNRQLNLIVSNAKVVGDEPGKRTVTIEQLRLTGMTNFVDYVFVDTHDVSLKENGYLVAGVSGFGSATKALILVISAVIR
jgi:type II secretory pathway component GspD/PulD (secretin)